MMLKIFNSSLAKSDHHNIKHEKNTKQRINKINMNNIAKQNRIREKITVLSNKCCTNPDLEICESYWSFLDDVEMVLDKQETRYHKNKMSNISDNKNNHNERWDVI